MMKWGGVTAYDIALIAYCCVAVGVLERYINGIIYNVLTTGSITYQWADKHKD